MSYFRQTHFHTQQANKVIVASPLNCGTCTLVLIFGAHVPQEGIGCPRQLLLSMTKCWELVEKEVNACRYHDAAIMGTRVPVAMIFIPCRKGLSHHPDEYSTPQQVGHGVKTLALTQARLAGTAGDGGKAEL